MTLVTEFILLVLLGVAGIVMALLANSLRRPSWLPTWHIVSGLCVLVLVAILLTLAQDTDGESSRQGRAAPSATTGPQISNPRGGVAVRVPPDSPTAAELAAELVDSRLLSWDDAAGRPMLFTSRVGHTHRDLAWDISTAADIAVIPRSTHMVVAIFKGPDADGRLEIHSLDGRLLRVLTRPARNESDTSPAIDVNSHTVYFIRYYWKNAAGGSRFTWRYQLMRVRYDRPDSPRPIATTADMGSVSADISGTTLAGACRHDPGPPQACVVDPSTGHSRMVTTNVAATVEEIQLSPDGHWIAYSSPESNPYGETEIYVVSVPRLGGEQPTRPILMTKLPGQNVFPAWAPFPSHPCLAFTHYERTRGSSIRLVCLDRPGVTAELLPVGSHAIWLGPSS